MKRQYSLRLTPELSLLVHLCSKVSRCSLKLFFFRIQRTLFLIKNVEMICRLPGAAVHLKLFSYFYPLYFSLTLIVIPWYKQNTLYVTVLMHLQHFTAITSQVCKHDPALGERESEQTMRQSFPVQRWSITWTWPCNPTAQHAPICLRVARAVSSSMAVGDYAGRRQKL